MMRHAENKVFTKTLVVFLDTNDSVKCTYRDVMKFQIPYTLTDRAETYSRHSLPCPDEAQKFLA